MSSRLRRAKILLDACAVDYVSGDKSEDIPTWKQTLEVYATPVGQRKYVHMYFAKSVSCWRDLRRKLSIPNDGSVISVGAGPGLCLMGWFWDIPPTEGQSVGAVDLLTWEHVRSLSPHAALFDNILQGSGYWFHGGLYFPPGATPPQAKGLGTLQPIPAASVPEGCTVLLPFVLNHLLGRYRPIKEPARVIDWLQEVRRRARRVLIVDMQSEERTSKFWTTLGEHLGAIGEPQCHSADVIEELRSAYSDTGDSWPWRRTSRFMRQYTPLMGTSSGWRFL